MTLEPRLLRRYGTWGETPWQYPDGAQPPIAVKQFTWTCEVQPTQPAGVAPQTLVYTGTAVLAVQDKENLEAVADAERRALAVLEAMVTAALEGRAYIRRPDVVGEMQEAVLTLLKSWVAQAAYPTNWDQCVAVAIAQAGARYNQQCASCTLLHAEDDREHLEWGLKIPIEPLPGPVVVLA